VLPGDVLVLAADAGVPVEVAVGDLSPVVIDAGSHEIGGLSLLVLAGADDAWVLGDELWQCDGQLLWDGTAVEARDATYLRRFDPASKNWMPVPVTAPESARPVGIRQLRDAGEVPADHGFGGARHRAPSAGAFDELTAVFALDLPSWDGDAVLDIEWAGDTAQLRVNGTTVDDRFWDGTRWSVSLRDVGAQANSALTLHILPLSAASTVWLPEAATAHRADAARGLVRSVALRVRSDHPAVD
jgi:hypothetical protein